MTSAATIPLYRREFPTYTRGAEFEAILADLSRAGFTDNSWHNDLNPKMTLDLGDDLFIDIFVADPEGEPDCPAVSVILLSGGHVRAEHNISSTNPLTVCTAFGAVLNDALRNPKG